MISAVYEPTLERAGWIESRSADSAVLPDHFVRAALLREISALAA